MINKFFIYFVQEASNSQHPPPFLKFVMSQDLSSTSFPRKKLFFFMEPVNSKWSSLEKSPNSSNLEQNKETLQRREHSSSLPTLSCPPHKTDVSSISQSFRFLEKEGFQRPLLLAWSHNSNTQSIYWWG